MTRLEAVSECLAKKLLLLLGEWGRVSIGVSGIRGQTYTADAEIAWTTCVEGLLQ